MALLAPPEVAETLGVSESTLAQWRYLRKGPRYVHVGRHVRYRPADVETWIEEQTIDTRS